MRHGERLLFVLVLLLVWPALGSSAPTDCEYQPLAEDVETDAFGIRRGTYAAYVRPVVEKLNVRASGPGSPIVGHVKKDQEVQAVGACGHWLEIRSGYLHGWIFGPLTCQTNVGIQVSSRDQTKTWGVGQYCEANSDEEIKERGMRMLRGEPAPRSQYRVVRDGARARAPTWGPPDDGRVVARVRAGTVVTAVAGSGWEEGGYRVVFDKDAPEFELTLDGIPESIVQSATERGVWISTRDLQKLEE